MSTASTPYTAEQLAAKSSLGDKRYELVSGELRMMSPAGGEHGRVAMRIGLLLGNHVEERKLGEVFAAETGFLLATDPDTVRAPDVAFVSAERYAELGNVRGYLPLAPDLVVEVVSPNDTSSQVEEKAMAWLRFGSELVLVVDPENQTVRTYREPESIEVRIIGELVDATDVVPGWRFDVERVF